MKQLLILLIILSNLNLFSIEKRKFTFEDAMKFEEIKSKFISNNGEWLIYTVKPDRGDGYAVVRSIEGEIEYKIERAEKPSYSEKMNVIAFSIKPKAIDYINAKKDEKPKNDLKILFTINGEQRLINEVNSYEITNDGNWIIYRKNKSNKKSDKKNEEDKKVIAEDAYLYHTNSKSEIFIENMSSYYLDSASNYLFYTVSSKNESRDGVYYRELKQAYAPEYIIEQDSASVFSKLTWNNRVNKLAYLFNDLDSSSKIIDTELNIWTMDNGVETIYKRGNKADWYLPKKNKLVWSEDGVNLYFGTKPEAERFPKPENEEKKIKEDTFYDIDEIISKSKLFLWHWDDPNIITRQKKLWKEKKNKTYLSVYHTNSKRIVQLSDPTIANVSFNGTKNYILGYDMSPYKKRQAYDGWYYDLYVIDQFNGSKKLISKELSNPAYMSKNGQYTAYFKDQHWHVYDVYSEKSISPTKMIKTVAFYNTNDDRPMTPRPFGFGFFMNDFRFYIYSEYDIWEINSKNGGIFSVTLAEGVKNKVRYRFNDIYKNNFKNNDKTYFIKGFNTKDKSSHLAVADSIGFLAFMKTDLEVLYNFITISKKSNKIIYTRESYNMFPNLWVMDTKLENQKQLSNVNPNINEFIWGDTEMIQYKDPQGEELQGYIIKPENFDSTKKYPLFVYFYEKFSDRRHKFQQPKVNHRPIYPLYIGEGYIMFFPDIKYYDGKPGKSGLDAVIAGCDKLIEKGFIDKDKIALHGHSWSGYQSAFFVSQTDYFTACVSGAPVSNMTSAYSGIRLGSGMARQFQYEKTQSRIGGNLIDSLDAYIANSPVFFADKINTPLLIMFGDADEAVPYQQGIELYLACRRFNKNCIMLQYENELHHLRKYYNKLDYAIKMKEFFGHYILGKPASEWIKEGLEYKGDYMRK